MKNKLEEKYRYWVVDTTNDANNEVVRYSNKTYSHNGYGNYKYHGYDGNTNCNGINCFNNIEDFINNPTLITLEEFRELIKNEFMFENIKTIL